MPSPSLSGTCWAFCPSEDQLLSKSLGLPEKSLVWVSSQGPGDKSVSLSGLRLRLPWTWTSLPIERPLELPEELPSGWVAQSKHRQVPTTKYFNMALFIFYFISGSKMCLPKEERWDSLARHSAGSLPSGHNLLWQSYFPQPLSSSKQTVLPPLPELSSCLKCSSLHPI